MFEYVFCLYDAASVEILTGMRSPAEFTIKMEALTMGAPEASICLSEHDCSHILALKTSQQCCPTALSFGIPVIFSAARLKDVIFRSEWTVTPRRICCRE